MGCICSKGIEADETVVDLNKGVRKSLKRLVTPLKNEDDDALSTQAEATAARSIGANARSAVKPQENLVAPLVRQSNGGENNSVVAFSDSTGMPVGHQRNRAVDVSLTGEKFQSNISGAGGNGGSNSGIFDVPNGFSGEHVAAGWPVWLTNVAPEAVNGWLPLRADLFEKLNKIGQGTYSSVYKARDLQTGKIVALKKVRFVNMDPESVRFMAREIHILRKLNHPNIVKLEGIVTSRMSCNLYLVFEYMDHDLAGLAATPGIKFTEPQIKCYMQQLFHGLQHCHSHGILHRDIKGSNLLIGNDGILKIADFGLATFFDPNQKQSLTSRVVTLWYRPPELLLGATEYGVAVDLWSSGCILAELLAGKPIMPGRTEVEQLHKIFKLCGSPPEEYWRKLKLPHATIFKPQRPYPRRIGEIFRDCPSPTLALLDTLLAIQPENRGTTTSALQSDFFTTKPLACDPSSLPTYPPSKEYDVKLRDEEARRQRVAARNVKASESSKKGDADNKPTPGQDTNGGLKGWQGQPNTKSASDKYSPLEEAGSGFPIDPPRPAQNNLTNSNSTMHPSAFGSSWIKKDDMRMINRASSTVRVPNAAQLRSQNSCIPPSGGMEFTNTSNMSSRHGRHDVAEPYEKQRELVRTSSTQKRDAMSGAHETTLGYDGKSRKIQYSGPLMPAGGNMEELLKEHERQIHQAVRKARLDKGYDGKSRKIQYSGPLMPAGGNMEELLKEHERQIHQAVRKARLDKGYDGKSRKIQYSGPLMPAGGNMEELLKEHERQIHQAVRKARLDKGYDGKSRKIQYSGPLMPAGGNMEELLKEHERQIHQAVRKARLDKGYDGKSRKIQYSGPLMPAGGNMEELLKEHERQIHQAVRKARLDKVKTKKHI